jgi:hypothetical protein
VGKNICNEIYKHKNYLGLQNKIKNKKIYNLKKNIFKLYTSKKFIKINKNNLLNFKDKGKIKLKKLKNLINLNLYYNINLNKKNKNINLYFYFNKDISYNFKKLQQLNLKI